jgi:hypothetical protein
MAANGLPNADVRQAPIPSIQGYAPSHFYDMKQTNAAHGNMKAQQGSNRMEPDELINLLDEYVAQHNTPLDNLDGNGQQNPQVSQPQNQDNTYRNRPTQQPMPYYQDAPRAVPQYMNQMPYPGMVYASQPEYSQGYGQSHPPAPANSKVEFEPGTSFRDEYKRNNKNNGQKNLRCFPACPKGRHNSHGFCGQGVHVRYTGNEANIRVYARFEQTRPTEESLLVGDFVPVEKITHSMKTVSNPLGEWMEGSLLDRRQLSGDVSTSVFEINGKRQSWHYAWASNRAVNHSTTHVLRVYFFTIEAQNMFRCIDILNSTSFLVLCSRRNEKKKKGTSAVTKVKRTVSKVGSSERIKSKSSAITCPTGGDNYVTTVV